MSYSELQAGQLPQGTIFIMGCYETLYANQPLLSLFGMLMASVVSYALLGLLATNTIQLLIMHISKF